jgi:hypothetical protein
LGPSILDFGCSAGRAMVIRDSHSSLTIMNEAVQSWIERASASAGVLACGVRLADRSFLVRSCAAGIPEAQVEQALHELWEAIYALQQNRIAPQRLCWNFQNARFRCVTRPGGVLAALLLTPEDAELAPIEQLLAEFNP